MYRRFHRFAVIAGLSLLLALTVHPHDASAQRIAKYGADFLASGVGGRALGMGGAYVALANNVTAGYWNPAGLSGLDSIEVAYMHAERFTGFVSFDYGAVGLPISPRSAVALSVIRSGVNNIKNTLHAWDPARNQPKPHPENHITTFSAADYAVLVGYSRSLNSRLSWGVTGKIIRRSIGDFASAWGYSFDVGARYAAEHLALGVTVQDVSTMLQSWSVNREKLSPLQDIFDMELPKGGTELVLPVVRLGSGVMLPVGPVDMTVGADVDVAFEGRRSYALNLGDVSFHPRMGLEISYRDLVSIRTGVNRLVYSKDLGYHITPTVGAGLKLNRLIIDYGFGNFAGMASDLGYTHRLSVRLKLGYFTQESSD